MFLKLAWRNLWRNKRRSLITISSILFAVVFAVFMRAFQIGSYEVMIKNVVNQYTGFLQLHQAGYWNDQTLDNTFEFTNALNDSLLQVKGVTETIPRLESFALTSSKKLTKGALIVGINPEKEKTILKIEDQLHQGKVIDLNDNKIMISEGLANYYKITSGDTLILLGQGYQAMTAAGKYAIKGIIKFTSPALNEKTIIMPLPLAQTFFSAQNRLTSLIIQKADNVDAKKLANNINNHLKNPNYEVLDWQTMLPELVQSIEADNSGGLIMIFVLYMIICFGIFGTILMMTAERRYEFGVLLAIGMRRWKIIIMIIYETIIMGILGVISGFIVVYPLIFYFNIKPITLSGEMAKMMEDLGFEPIMPTSLNPTIAIAHAAIILVISIFLSLYPTLVINKLKPVEAMRH